MTKIQHKKFILATALLSFSMWALTASLVLRNPASADAEDIEWRELGILFADMGVADLDDKSAVLESGLARFEILRMRMRTIKQGSAMVTRQISDLDSKLIGQEKVLESETRGGFFSKPDPVKIEAAATAISESKDRRDHLAKDISKYAVERSIAVSQAILLLKNHASRLNEVGSSSSNSDQLNDMIKAETLARIPLAVGERNLKLEELLVAQSQK